VVALLFCSSVGEYQTLSALSSGMVVRSCRGFLCFGASVNSTGAGQHLDATGELRGPGGWGSAGVFLSQLPVILSAISGGANVSN